MVYTDEAAQVSANRSQNPLYEKRSKCLRCSDDVQGTEPHLLA